jgi:hypothetical protein
MLTSRLWFLSACLLVLLQPLDRGPVLSNSRIACKMRAGFIATPHARATLLVSAADILNVLGRLIVRHFPAAQYDSPVFLVETELHSFCVRNRGAARSYKAILVYAVRSRLR